MTFEGACTASVILGLDPRIHSSLDAPIKSEHDKREGLDAPIKSEHDKREGLDAPIKSEHDKRGGLCFSQA